MSLREKIFIWFIAVVFLMGQWGCATRQYGHTKPEPLLEKYREQLGTIGVTTGPDVLVIQIDRPTPTPKTGVLEGMGQGAQKSWQGWKEDILEPVWGG